MSIIFKKPAAVVIGLTILMVVMTYRHTKHVTDFSIKKEIRGLGVTDVGSSKLDKVVEETEHLKEVIISLEKQMDEMSSQQKGLRIKQEANEDAMKHLEMENKNLRMKQLASGHSTKLLVKAARDIILREDLPGPSISKNEKAKADKAMEQWRSHVKANPSLVCDGLVDFAATQRMSLGADQGATPANQGDDRIVMTLIAGRGGQANDDFDVVLEEWKRLYKSVMLMSSMNVTMYIATDPKSVGFFEETCSAGNKALRDWVHVTGRDIQIECHVSTITKVQVKAWRDESNCYGDKIDHHSGVYGAAKMFFHRVFTQEMMPGVKDALFIDTDMVFVDDPAKLWAKRHASDEKEIFKMYGVESFVCSCLMVLHYDRLWELDRVGIASPHYNGTKTYPQIVDWMIHDKKASGKLQSHGDQRILLGFNLVDKGVVGQLPTYWDMEGCNSLEMNVFNLHKAGIFHENCNWESWYNYLFSPLEYECAAGVPSSLLPQ